jgi:hypothetical protein
MYPFRNFLIRHLPRSTRTRALELLAAAAEIAAPTMMLVPDFSIDFMLELARTGLATATPERVEIA